MRASYTGWLLALVLGISLLLPTVVQATHVRAGEITTRRLNRPGAGLTYEITLTAYYDIIEGSGAAQAADNVDFCFGDGTPSRQVPRESIRPLNRGTSINIYRVIYTYPGPGVYSISARIVNRNDGTRNIRNGASLDVNFFVTTTISANASLGFNSNPVLLNPPVDTARIGQKYCHNPAAYDPDGDSLAYRIAIPQYSSDGAICRSLAVPQYQLPNQIQAPGRNEAGGSPATFTVNPITGDVCWDAPVEAGQYNYAFVIEEWRSGVLIGEIVRDVQVIVLDANNRRPLIDPIADICAEAGTLITQNIRVVDPDGNRVVIQGFGGPFNRSPDNVLFNPPVIPAPYATLTPNGVGQASPATSVFNWQTICAQIRQEPYQITIKATDQPTNRAPSLASFATFGIQLIGPRPQNLTGRGVTVGNASGRAIQLTWSPYSCSPPGGADQAPAEMLVYRKEGCDNRPVPPCFTGILSGYTRIGRVPLTATTFTDTTGLRRGVSYSYRIVAQYPLPVGGESVVSAEFCLALPLLAPVLTNVTVDSTGPATGAMRGVITVRWIRPIGLNPADGGGPFEYRLFRAPGLSGTEFTQVTAIQTSLQPVGDTVFVDRGLNTEGTAYTYRLEFFVTNPAGQLVRQDATEAATSVRLTTTPVANGVNLSWAVTTPWSNDNQTHRVYRSRTGPNGPFNLVATVPVTGPASYTYADRGGDTFAQDGITSGALSPDSSYCYRIETVGTYADATIRAKTGGLLYNFSQIQCASPTDTTRPCPPNLTIDLLDCPSLAPDALCAQSTFTNTLNWQYPVSVGGRTCDTRVVSYNIYYARYEGDSLRQIATVNAPITTFLHQSLSTVAGCYYVTAVNTKGTESEPSNRVCKDICPYFAVPNVITPNGDGKNDTFRPLDCPRFVETVEFVVYNRWGARVYQSTGPVVNWPGTTQNGNPLPGGVYYYEVTARFAGLTRGGPVQTTKGYVQLIRDGVSMR
ncbi:gliding motility-associated C-terminal domain-containing protein [Fibrella aquatica]|jgi:gliding motility-associated-like protein|uniref:T9SS type B sorting domain-containing protein n=1 Tax=Fibrella aquatica TaxID=3242487 RepID=UPI0035207028